MIKRFMVLFAFVVFSLPFTLLASSNDFYDDGELNDDDVVSIFVDESFSYDEIETGLFVEDCKCEDEHGGTRNLGAVCPSCDNTQFWPNLYASDRSFSQTELKQCDCNPPKMGYVHITVTEVKKDAYVCGSCDIAKVEVTTTTLLTYCYK